MEKKIKQLQDEIKEKEQELKNAKIELKRLEKYRHLVFSNNQNMRGEYLQNDIRNLILRVASVQKKTNIDGEDFFCFFDKRKSVKELNSDEIKICNDFVSELQVLVLKYSSAFCEKGD